MESPRIVLASASPRRRELLAAANLRFEVRPADVDETLEHFDDPSAAALELARRKARALASRLGGDPALVIGADTIVGLRIDGAWRSLGKAKDEADERSMLGLLSNSRHAVVTGVCVLRTLDGAVFEDSEWTWVTMRELTPREIDDYVASGEWRDKAGGYAIQESADRFVLRLEGGGFDNVVGLPVARTLELLARARAEPLRT